MTGGRRWPTASEYADAVKDAPSSFRPGPLASATYATASLIPGMDDEPAMASGQNAVVFEAEVAGFRQAVRCFTTAPTHGEARYDALARHLRAAPVSAIATAHWVEDGVEVGGHVYPLVTMEWIDGLAMSAWVESRLDDATAIRRLDKRWLALCSSLRRNRVAHGDLQHGNVLVDERGRPRLIDLDGVWVPAIADRPPTEVGHPNYQHPDRLTSGTWGEYIDWFSALVVHTSLLAVAADPALWRFHDGENLLLTKDDLADPDREVWGALRWSVDPEVRRLASLVQAALDVDPGSELDLDEILTHGVVGGSRRPGCAEPRPPRDTPTTSWYDGPDDAPPAESPSPRASPPPPSPPPPTSPSPPPPTSPPPPPPPPPTSPPPPRRAATGGPAASGRPTKPGSAPNPPRPGSGPKVTRPPKPGSSTRPPPGSPSRPPKPGRTGPRPPGPGRPPPPSVGDRSRPPKPGADNAKGGGRAVSAVGFIALLVVGAGLLPVSPIAAGVVALAVIGAMVLADSRSS